MRIGREPDGLANDPEGPDIQRLQPKNGKPADRFKAWRPDAPVAV